MHFAGVGYTIKAIPKKIPVVQGVGGVVSSKL
jgi:hypothetical protein